MLMLILVSIKFAARTARNENVAVNLHHLFCRHTSSRVQVVHVLRNEQELSVRWASRAIASCAAFGRALRMRCRRSRYQSQTNCGSRANASGVASFVGSRFLQ